MAPVAPVLSTDQLREIEDARGRWGRVRRVVTVSRASTGLLGFTAGIFLLIGIGSPEYAVLGMLLAGVAAVEYLGGEKLRKADPRGAVLLAWNQALLIGLAGVYCFYKGFVEPPPPPSELEQLFGSAMVQDGLRQWRIQGTEALVQNKEPMRKLMWAVSALGVLLTQGVLALYYFSRRRVVEAYLRATPAWVVEVQRRAA